VSVNTVQLYRILYGDWSPAGSRERLRWRRSSTDSLPGLSDELLKQLADVPGLAGTKTYLLDHLAGTSTSLLGHLLEAGRIPTDGIIYRLIRDNPKLLMNPEIRRLVIGLLKAAARNQMDSCLATYDFNKIIASLKVIRQADGMVC